MQGELHCEVILCRHFWLGVRLMLVKSATSYRLFLSSIHLLELEASLSHTYKGLDLTLKLKSFRLCWFHVGLRESIPYLACSKTFGRIFIWKSVSSETHPALDSAAPRNFPEKTRVFNSSKKKRKYFTNRTISLV